MNNWDKLSTQEIRDILNVSVQSIITEGLPSDHWFYIQTIEQIKMLKEREAAEQ